MKPLLAALLLALVASPALASDVVDTTFAKAQGPHAFNVRDLVMMDRVSDPQLSPDGRHAAFSVRSTDYAGNKGVTAIYVLDLERKGAQPVKVVDKGSSARWSADGTSLYFVAPAKDVAQLWRVDLGADLSHPATPVQVSHGPLDIVDYKLGPDGKQVLLSYEVFTDCATLACTEQRIETRAKDKASGTLYKKLFVRHWDTWADGRRNQLFVGAFNADGQLPAEPTLLSRGIDGDVPSKPFGDASEFAFAPEWTWNLGGAYRWDNGVFVNLDAGYRSKSYGVSGPTQGANKLDARTLLGGKIGYQAERWTLAAYATNLLDEEYVQFRQPTLNRAMYGAPRVFGAVLETRW